MSPMPFLDRADAGRHLANVLAPLKGSDLVVLGLPRGGVPVAYQVARALAAPLDVIIVRKLGLPFQPELAMGAVGEGGVVVVDSRLVGVAGVSEAELFAIEAHEQSEVERRARRFREGRAPVPIDGRRVVIVDDGLATGATALAACQVARARGASDVILAVPVCAPDSAERLRSAADRVVCLEEPGSFAAVGQWYRNFTQTTDAEVIALLSERRADRAAGDPAPGAPADDPAPGDPDDAAPGDPDDAFVRYRDVTFAIGSVRLAGQLVVPEGSNAVVIFAHGSGSSRHSPRNRFVAEALRARGLSTLLFDLLTTDEEATRSNVFDIGLLAARLEAVTRWLRAEQGMQDVHIGYFGASTGAGAALWAAGAAGTLVEAVVSRGGRPDLAGSRLSAVQAPTLLIVGSEDRVVLDLNRRAAEQLRCQHQLAIIPGASHLFEEPGTLAQVASLAAEWFKRHLDPHRVTTASSH